MAVTKYLAGQNVKTLKGEQLELTVQVFAIDRKIACNYSTCFPNTQSPVGQQAASFD